MPGWTYSVIGFIAIVIHCTINRDNLFNKNTSGDPAIMKSYSRFLYGILAYYITDALWGVFDALKWVKVLYCNTCVYYVAMSLAVVFWAEYVVAYLNQKNAFGKALLYIGRGFLGLEILALIVNIINPIFFSISADGVYTPGPVRYIALYVQIVLFLVTSIQTIFIAQRKEGAEKRRNIAISLFGVAMTLAIVAQIEYPLLPIYSIGYLIGACFLHIYVEEDEQDEHIKEISDRMDIISTFSGIYFCSYYIDMQDFTYEELANSSEAVEKVVGKKGNIIEGFERMCENLVKPEFRKEMEEFVQIDNLNERMMGKRYISNRFDGVNAGWSEGVFIAGDRNPDGTLRHVVWAIRTIKEQKEKEDQLLYNSYVDELTGLFNRKMFAEYVEDKIDELMQVDFTYISMDVNGLKTVNDNLGHAAGDELIRGAARCMKDSMRSYGKVYRTGGDEFTAVLMASPEDVEEIMADFKARTKKFKGKYVENISVSCGIVIKKNEPGLNFLEIEKLADKRMYEAKSEYYRETGIDRRGQQSSAFRRLCAMYSKVLQVNLTSNTFNIFVMDEGERVEEKGFRTGIYEWLEEFGKSGQVHPEDLDYYFEHTSREFLTSLFSSQERLSYYLKYRRMFEGEYRYCIMDLIPAEDYTPENQKIYLYVKYLES